MKDIDRAFHDCKVMLEYLEIFHGKEELHYHRHIATGIYTTGDLKDLMYIYNDLFLLFSDTPASTQKMAIPLFKYLEHFKKKLHRIMKRGSIKTDIEFEMIRALLDVDPNNIDYPIDEIQDILDKYEISAA